ncbi:phenylacetate--CoA ligase family protein [Cognatitamlana onchidii]|uniref:phenylacetate--CoA ligase family protein n=1 Tax=Cognatitamlana onchidii TaxID=2562860 RepID=UPI0010A6A572|nr:phenylacetate--CoA ligase family protein [Algibacter onchidii]
MRHAIETTAFYKNLKINAVLEDFPVVNKNILRLESEKLISKNFRNKKKYSVTTSGSTGTPLTVIQDKNKRLRNMADLIYFSNLAHYKIGFKLLFLRRWSDDLKKSKLLSWMQNISAIDVLNLDNQRASKIINNLSKDKSNKVWLGYASGFEVMCRCIKDMNAKPIHAKVQSVIAVAEALTPFTKKSMQYYFNAPVVSRYSNMENGILAQQLPYKGEDFVINWASYHFEILQLDKDVPVKPGESGRIVLTDLFNFGMPIIRYDTGDVGCMDHSVSPPVFKHIEGRKSDLIFNTKGIIVPSMIIASVEDFRGIIQAQLIQEDKMSYTLKLNCDEVFKQETELILEFKNYLGDDALINIEYVDEIPLLNSGKRRATVNNYIK